MTVMSLVSAFVNVVAYSAVLARRRFVAPVAATCKTAGRLGAPGIDITVVQDRAGSVALVDVAARQA